MENQGNIAKKRHNPQNPNFAGKRLMVLRDYEMSNHSIISDGLRVFTEKELSKLQ